MSARGRQGLWLALALATALAYLWGLDGAYIPKFGDEMVYSHIARITAQSGQWLPLQSEYSHMRNTKPPLLFWQAMVAGQWGADWRLGALRLPSVLYTWGTALMAALLAARLWRQRQPGTASGQAPGNAPALQAGLVAATVFLLFFSSLRYSRTYLTSGPETFWMFGIMAALVWAPARLLASRLWFPLAAGLALGLACLYKSFVLVIPVGFALVLCHLLAHEPGQAPRRGAGPLLSAGLKAALSAVVALVVFSLWFILDPNPGDIWREFIVGENVGRMQGGPGYLSIALGGASGIWVILLACFTNAGLLLPLVAGAALAAWRAARRGEPASAAEKVLWLWILALTLFFLVPSQRTARYLIPAMPAVAILVALHWRGIHRGWFSASIVLSLLALLVLGVAASGGAPAVGQTIYAPVFWLLLAGTVAAGVAGLCRAALAPAASLVGALGTFLAMTALYAPFNGSLGQFKPATLRALQGEPVAVAYQFTGQQERYRFLLPGVQVKAVKAPPPRTEEDLAQLFGTARYALVERWPGEAACRNCRVVDARWEPGSRPGGSVLDALLRPESYWFSQEYLVERPGP